MAIPKPETEAGRERRLAQWEAWHGRVRETASRAWETGRVFYVVKLNLGGTVGSWTGSLGDDVSGALQTIEAVGWRLDSTGYVYQPVRKRPHALPDTAQMAGNIVGIYTFRRPGPPPLQT